MMTDFEKPFDISGIRDINRRRGRAGMTIGIGVDEAP